MNDELADRECVPCRRGGSALEASEVARLAAELGDGWRVIDGHHLRRDVQFRDFADALAFVNRVGALAEEVGHHPDLALGWGKVTVEIWTHTVDGLSEADFVFAAKVDRLG